VRRQIREAAPVVAVNTTRNLTASWTGCAFACRVRMDQHCVPYKLDPFGLQPSGQERPSIPSRCHW
jgi:hypothetical protein